MKDIVWNAVMLREFRHLAALTEEEDAVLHDWAQGKSIVSTALRCHMSERKVNNLRASIRAKYDSVRPFTPLLPKRLGR